MAGVTFKILEIDDDDTVDDAGTCVMEAVFPPHAHGRLMLAAMRRALMDHVLTMRIAVVDIHPTDPMRLVEVHAPPELAHMLGGVVIRVDRVSGVDDVSLFGDELPSPVVSDGNPQVQVESSTDLTLLFRTRFAGFPMSCRCGAGTTFCEMCSLRFELDVTAPADACLLVTSSHLRWVGTRRDIHVTVASGIPITKLPAGARLRVTAFATLGSGSTHANWSPVVAPCVQPELHIDILEPGLVVAAARFPDLFEVVDGALVRRAGSEFNQEWGVIGITAYARAMQREHRLARPPLIAWESETRFRVCMESTGAMRLRDMLTSSIQVMLESVSQNIIAFEKHGQHVNE
jgi:hypothetical protein